MSDCSSIVALEAKLREAIRFARLDGYKVLDCGDNWIVATSEVRKCSAIGALLLHGMTPNDINAASVPLIHACLKSHGLSTLNAIAIDDGYDGRLYTNEYNALGARLRTIG